MEGWIVKERSLFGNGRDFVWRPRLTYGGRGWRTAPVCLPRVTRAALFSRRARATKKEMFLPHILTMSHISHIVLFRAVGVIKREDYWVRLTVCLGLSVGEEKVGWERQLHLS